MMPATTIKIKSHTKNLKEIRSFIHGASSEHGFSKQEIDGIVLAVDEACTNIIRHAYNGNNTKDIIITTEASPEEFVITLQDFGKKPDLYRLENPPPEKLRKGRYGVIFMKKIMDKIDYDLSPEKGTILKLIKYRK